MKTVVALVIGEMGSGKNYHGERLAKIFNMQFLDGDLAVPIEMIERVKNFHPLSREMIASFVKVNLLPAIDHALANTCNPNGLIVAQALYFDDDRELVKNHLEASGKVVRFVHVEVPLWQNVKQLLSRPRGVLWVLYWLRNKPYFEKPRKISALRFTEAEKALLD